MDAEDILAEPDEPSASILSLGELVSFRVEFVSDFIDGWLNLDPLFIKNL